MIKEHTWKFLSSVIGEDPSHSCDLSRMRVPGGWLYIRDIFCSVDASCSRAATAMAFVPDPPKKRIKVKH